MWGLSSEGTGALITVLEATGTLLITLAAGIHELALVGIITTGVDTRSASSLPLAALPCTGLPTSLPSLVVSSSSRFAQMILSSSDTSIVKGSGAGTRGLCANPASVPLF